MGNLAPSIGIDIIEIARIREALRRRPRLAAKLFTEVERAYCECRADPAPHYAVRFSAKEATAKAFGRWLRWQEVEISNDPAGRPYLVLHGEAAALLSGGRLSLSLSHSRDYAIACVLLENPQEIACLDQNLPSRGVWT